MLQRPHLEYSLTARTAESATTHSVVHRLQASTPASPNRLLMQRDTFTCHTTCPCAFCTRKPAPPASTVRTVPRAALANRSRLVRSLLIHSPARTRESPTSPCRRHRRDCAHRRRC